MSNSSPSPDNPVLGPWLSFCFSRLSFLDGVSTYSDASILDSSRVKLDQEFEALQAASNIIKARRNALSSATRLHPEILAHIFSFLAAEEIPKNTTRRIPTRRGLQIVGVGSKGEVTLGWMRVTHVCRLWRKIALDHPSLWGIDVDSLRPCTIERLRRSKQAPLVVRYNNPVNTLMAAEQDILRSLLAESPRTSELALTCPQQYAWDSMAHLMVVRAPLLEAFSYSTPQRRMGQSCILPWNLFAGDAPRLRKISLTDARLPLESSLYDHLTHLSLSTSEYGPAPMAAFTRDELLAVLARMTELEKLELSWTIPSALEMSALLPANAAVALPRLKKLKLAAQPADCLKLAEYLTIPTTTAIHLSCHEHGNPDDEYPVKRQRLIDLLMRQVPVPLQSILINRPAGCVEFTGWTTMYNPITTAHGADDPHAQVYLHLSAGRIPLRSLDEEMLRLMLDRLDENALRAMHVNVGDQDLRFQHVPWPEIMGEFNAVELVSVGPRTLPHFLEALGTAPVLGAPAAGFLFPQLRRLRLYRISFEYPSGTGLGLPPPGGGIIEGMLARRREWSPGFEEVEVVDCHVTPAHIDALRAIMPHVIWDGRSCEAHEPLQDMFLGPGDWPELVEGEEEEEEDGDVMAAFFDGGEEPWEDWEPQEPPEEVEIFNGHGLGEAAQIFASLGF